MIKFAVLMAKVSQEYCLKILGRTILKIIQFSYKEIYFSASRFSKSNRMEKEIWWIVVACEYCVNLPACEVGLNGMVYHKIGGTDRVDFFRVTTESTHGISHCGKVHDRRHTAETQTTKRTIQYMQYKCTCQKFWTVKQ